MNQDQKTKLHDLDFLINILSNDEPGVEEWFSKEKVKEIIPYLKELKGFINFIDKYGEANLDILNMSMTSLALDGLPKTTKEYHDAIWYAFQVGLNHEKKGKIIDEQSGQN